MKPIAYAYEADYHCENCTRKRFGPACEGTDNEGNSVGALFSWEEWFDVGYGNQTLACGDCGAILDEYEEQEQEGSPTN